MYEGPGQEWMQMIAVDDFAAFDHAESRTDLRRSPFPGLGQTDGNGIRAVVAGESISLRRCDADFPVLRKVSGVFSGGTFRDTAQTATGSMCTHNFRPPSGKEGQKERKYEHKEFHAVQRYEKK